MGETGRRIANCFNRMVAGMGDDMRKDYPYVFYMPTRHGWSVIERFTAASRQAVFRYTAQL